MAQETLNPQPITGIRIRYAEDNNQNNTYSDILPFSVKTQNFKYKDKTLGQILGSNLDTGTSIQDQINELTTAVNNKANITQQTFYKPVLRWGTGTNNSDISGYPYGVLYKQTASNTGKYVLTLVNRSSAIGNDFDAINLINQQGKINIPQKYGGNIYNPQIVWTSGGGTDTSTNPKIEIKRNSSYLDIIHTNADSIPDTLLHLNLTSSGISCGYGIDLAWGIGTNNRYKATSSDYPRAELRFAGASAAGTGNVSIYAYTTSASYTGQSLVTSSGNINIVQKYKPALYFPIGSNNDGQVYPRAGITSSGTADNGTNNIRLFYKADENTDAIGQTLITSSGEINISPKNHRSTEGIYGLGSSTYYGHTKVINNLTTSTANDGEALNAYQGYALNNKITQLNNKITQLNTVLDEVVYNSTFDGENIKIYAKRLQSGMIRLRIIGLSSGTLTTQIKRTKAIPNNTIILNHNVLDGKFMPSAQYRQFQFIGNGYGAIIIIYPKTHETTPGQIRIISIKKLFGTDSGDVDNLPANIDFRFSTVYTGATLAFT